MENGSLRIVATALLSSALAMTMAQPVAAFELARSLADRALVCEGGSENRGADYRFQTYGNMIERVDSRFPNSKVVFKMGAGHKAQLESYWSYETLSQKNGSHVMLYERLSLRSQVQTQHIYRTYELFSQNGQTYMTIYDGVNGARDWKMKVTRKCHAPGFGRRTYVTRKMPNKYWDPNN